MMNSSQLKKAVNDLMGQYELLKEPGIFNPGPNGRRIGTATGLVALFHYEPHFGQLYGVFRRMTGTQLDEILANDAIKKVTPDERSAIANQHVNFAETVMFHHTENIIEKANEEIAEAEIEIDKATTEIEKAAIERKKANAERKKAEIEKAYKGTIEVLEEVRGDRLKEIADRADSTPLNWTEYAYWLIGRADKLVDSDPEASQHYKKSVKDLLRKAHDAGYIEATAALGGFLYSETEQVDKAIKLWEKAAAAGNEDALKDLFEVLCADDSQQPREKIVSLAKADDSILKKLFNTLTNETDLTPEQKNGLPLVSDAIALQEKKAQDANQTLAGTSLSARASLGNIPVPA